jgi:hypothetical protein
MHFLGQVLCMFFCDSESLMVVLPRKLLAVDEPAPVSVYNEGGKPPFLLVANHAGNLIPRALGRLGIAEGGWSENRDSPWPKLLDFWGLPTFRSSIATPTPQNALSRLGIDESHALLRLN